MALLCACATSGESVRPAQIANDVPRLRVFRGVLARKVGHDLDRVVQISKDVLAVAALELVREADGAPLFTSDRADGTPITATDRRRNAFPSGTVVRRSGCAGMEFLSSTSLNIARPYEALFLVRCCRTLLQLTWKPAHASLQAGLRDWRSLRQMDHAGCATEHLMPRPLRHRCS